MTVLFDNYLLNGKTLKNRAVVAPMTRARAPGNVPNELTVRYYGQRTDAGLIVTEGTPISQQGCGFIDCPGIWNQDQIDAWSRVTKHVHDLGSLIFTQIWHVGRISHVSLQENNQAPVSSTDKQAQNSSAFAYDADGQHAFVPASKPHRLTTSEAQSIIEDFAQAAENALTAGFDGVEIHGANGYLIEQFINAVVNDRQDQYGGNSIENRVRFALEVVDACIKRVGAERVAIRLSPFGRLHDLGDFDEEHETFLHLARELNKRGIAYVHIMDQASRGSPAIPNGFIEKFRCAYQGTLILAGGMDLKKANQLLTAGIVDLVAFGEKYIANPDLLERYRHGWPLETSDPSLYYGGDERGYTDYLAY